MILPWSVDVPQDRLPFANWLLIMLIIAVFAWQVPQFQQRHEAIHNFNFKKALSAKTGRIPPDMNSIKNIKVTYDYYMLNGWTLKGLFSHMWLHGNVMHLIGNLLFLWIFGNAVCAKIGNIIYIPIYIILGIFAGIAHLLFSNTPALGASGAINGIVGMYLVLFPTNSITCYCWTFSLSYLREFDCSSYIMILLWFTCNIFGVIIGAGKIAYFAHIGGFVAGFTIAVILLKIKYITMTNYEKSLLQVFADFRSIPQAKVFHVYRADRFENKKVQSVDSEKEFFSKTRPPSLVQSAAVPKLVDNFVYFECECGKHIKMDPQYAGRTVKCTQCKKTIKIPNR